MKRRTKLFIAGAVTAAVIGTGAGIGIAIGSDDDDGTEVPITGPALERATNAALDHTGEGRVTGTEAGDEEGAYEVEVTLDDGSQVDVHLDGDFNVIGAEADDESEDEGGDD